MSPGAMSQSGGELDRRLRASAIESNLKMKVWERIMRKRLREMGTVDTKVQERLVEQHCANSEVKGTALGTIEGAMQVHVQLICSDSESLEKRRGAHERLSNLLRGIEAAIRPPATVSVASITTSTATDSSSTRAQETQLVAETVAHPPPGTICASRGTRGGDTRWGPPPRPPTRTTSGNQWGASNQSLTTDTDDGDAICESSPKRRRSWHAAEVPRLRRSSRVSVDERSANGDSTNGRSNSSNNAVGIITGATLPQQHQSPSCAGTTGSATASTNGDSCTTVTTEHRRPFIPQPSVNALQFLQYYGYNTLSCARQVLEVSPDKQITSQLNYTRSIKLRTYPLKVQFDQERLDHALACTIDTRLDQWDPYWKVVDYLGVGRTSGIKACEPNGTSIQTAGLFSFNPGVQNVLMFKKAMPLQQVRGIPWNRQDDTGYTHAIRLHMLPLKTSAAAGSAQKKRADTHLWPKGTFLEVNSSRSGKAGNPNFVTQTVALQQRKQESHDATKWCGICEPLHLNEHVGDPSQPFSFSMVCHDKEEYMYSVTLCRRRSVDEMYSELTGEYYQPQGSTHSKTRRGPLDDLYRLRPLCTVPKTKGLKLATEVSQYDTNLIGADELVKKVSLLCPMSRTPLKNPVRSPNCRHVGCFDLYTFLRSQESVTFQRWRCPHCENFVSLHELEICAFTLELIDTYRNQIDEKRSDIGLRRNGTHYLLPERVPRSKRRAASEATRTQKRKVTEVIEID